MDFPHEPLLADIGGYIADGRVREIRQHGSEGGAAQTNAPFLPLSE
jgi:hypothetical protein